jgi:nicotinate phosphoribosyltransferase
VGVSADAPCLDSAYKLVAYGDRPVLKLSPETATAPSAKQVFRAPDAHRELVGLREEPAPKGHEPLLVPVMAAGRRSGPGGGVEAARARFQADLAWLPEQARAIHEPRAVPVAFSEQAERLHEQARQDVGGPECGRHPVRAPAEHCCIQ